MEHCAAAAQRTFLYRTLHHTSSERTVSLYGALHCSRQGPALFVEYFTAADRDLLSLWNTSLQQTGTCSPCGIRHCSRQRPALFVEYFTAADRDLLSLWNTSPSSHEPLWNTSLQKRKKRLLNGTPYHSSHALPLFV